MAVRVSMDSNVMKGRDSTAGSPAASRMDVFDELLGRLRSLHEEACAGKDVLEGRCSYLSSQEGVEDPWLPMNFSAPLDGPQPRALPWRVNHFGMHCDIPVIDGLAKQQEYLCQSISKLTEQQRFLVNTVQAVKKMPTPVRANKSLMSRVGSEKSNKGKSQVTKGGSKTMEWRNTMSAPTASSLFSSQSTAGFAKYEEHCCLAARLERIVRSHFFEVFFNGVIFANCLVMAFELQYYGMNYGSAHFSMKGSFDWSEDSFDIADWCFGILFVIELIANVLVHRVYFFFTPVVSEDENDEGGEDHHAASEAKVKKLTGMQCVTQSKPVELCCRIDLWGLLDLSVVVFWLLHRLSSTTLPFDPSVLKLGRVGKLLRMLKMVKVVASFDALYLLTTTIQGSMSALGWSVVLLFVVQSFLSFIMCQQLSSYVEDDSQNYEDRKQIWLYFGTYTRSLFTMFEITLGNWPPVGRALMDKVSMWFFLFSLLHKLVIGFAVVNVMNGVFMQTTFRIAATDDQLMIRQRQRAARIHKNKMTKLFRRADVDGTGFLSKDNFEEMAVDPSLRKWMASMELSIFKPEDVEKIFNLLSGDDGKIYLDELVKETSRLKGGARTVDMELGFKEIKDAVLHLERSVRTSHAPKGNGSI